MPAEGAVRLTSAPDTGWERGDWLVVISRKGCAVYAEATCSGFGRFDDGRRQLYVVENEADAAGLADALLQEIDSLWAA